MVSNNPPRGPIQARHSPLTYLPSSQQVDRGPPNTPQHIQYRNNATIQRPESRIHISRTPVLRPPMIRIRQPWEDWTELAVKLKFVRPDETTYNLFRNFKKEGEIVFLEIYEDREGKRDGAKIRFSPPPRRPFWINLDNPSNPHAKYEITLEDNATKYLVQVSLMNNNKNLGIPSPVRKMIYYPQNMKLPLSKLHFGVMTAPNSMMRLASLPLETLPSQISRTPEMDLTVDLHKKRLVVTFDIALVDPRMHEGSDFNSPSQIGEYNRVNKYQFQVPFDQISMLRTWDINQQECALALSLQSPPQYYRFRENIKAGHSKDNLIWSQFDSWYRQTDLYFDPYTLDKRNVALHKEQPVIDLGRWTTYILAIPSTGHAKETYTIIKQALGDFNIDIVSVPKFIPVESQKAALWSMIDPPQFQNPSTDLQDLTASGLYLLPFEVRYQLEVCISREIINEHNITEPFVCRLAEIAGGNISNARNILEFIAGKEERVYEPMTIFENKEALSFSAKTEIPHYCSYARKVTITPTTMYFSSPTVETTNRVIRHYYKENREGRFLRVQFTDELLEGRINSSAKKNRNDELFTRVYRTLRNGIQIGDRHYQFLAFGNSQFRENGAYFFCPTAHLSCEDIRQWMGNFSHINIAAKYAARLGQCFSTTRAINGLSQPTLVAIEDIETGKYCFTDGVGKISPFLAQMIATELGVRSSSAPSAFQFRLGGCKGILVVSPDAREKEVHIRKSQEKFTAVYHGLEIIRCSRFSAATLNRQTITILSALGVPDEVFLKMLSEQLANYQTAMNNDDLAVSLLLRYIDDNQMTINIATMIRNGFMAKRDPFVLSLLHLWRAWSIKLLKEKAKIIIENGAFVFGCVDETGTLRGYKKPTVAPGEQFAEEELPQIFIQVPDKEDHNRYNVIEGICLVGRNPSLHPGDLRVVQAINVPALHHLRDVVVFPSKGERDIPSMCSGGDLDGDDYFVIWDNDLRPLEWNCEPMNYTPPKAKVSKRPVVVGDLMKFFVNFMKNDTLPTIAHAHLAQSDFLLNGVKDPKCLELAALHSKAVDYVKTGEPAEMKKSLSPRKWPHFMEKKYKPKEAQYHSYKILGQLYDRVEIVNFVPQYNEPFDKRILRAYELSDTLLKSARQVKRKYDTAMKRLLAQQEINTEFEIWSTFVLTRPRVGSDYKVQEEIVRLSDALKDQFRAVCVEIAGGQDFSVLGPFVAAMYKITKEELDIALAECRGTKMVGGREVPKRRIEPKYMPLISFPWLFEKELGRIATGIDGAEELEDLGLAHLSLNDQSRGHKRRGGPQASEEDLVLHVGGNSIYRGDNLSVFPQDISEDNENDSDLDHERANVVQNEFSEVVSETDTRRNNDRSGFDDIVPRIELDGLLGPLDSGNAIHSASPNYNGGQRIPSPAGDCSGSSVGSHDQDTPQHSPVDKSNMSLGLTGPISATKSIDKLDLDEAPKLVLSEPILDLFDDETDSSVEGEEVVILDIKESALEKLQRMHGGPSFQS